MPRTSRTSRGMTEQENGLDPSFRRGDEERTGVTKTESVAPDHRQHAADVLVVVAEPRRPGVADRAHPHHHRRIHRADAELALHLTHPPGPTPPHPPHP